MRISNALVALPGEDRLLRRDVVVEKGKFTAFEEPGLGGEFDASGLAMFPGAIDPHVHFDEPGFTHREDFLHGSAEAARGGVTTVIDMPCTSLPPVVDSSALRNKLASVGGSALVDYAFYGGIRGGPAAENVEEAVADLAPDVVGFKCYFVSGMDTFPAIGDQRFARAIRACAKAGRPLLLHAEDADVVTAAAAELAARRGGRAPGWPDYYRSRPMAAETAACERALALAEGQASTLHVVHVGTAAAAEMLRREGASCETCAHYLAFSEEDFERLGPSLKTAPPVKDRAQRARLMELLAEGVISFVTSDHAGAPDYEKFTGDPLSAYGGIPGTGTMFPFLLSEGFLSGRLSLARFLRATCGAAAERFGISEGKGSLAPGKDADFVLADLGAENRFRAEDMFSKSRVTPFDGFRLKGRVEATFLRGVCVYRSDSLAAKALGGRPGLFANRTGGIVAQPGYGQFIRWGYR